MNWLVYILQSEVDGDYYKGVTQNIETRLLEHNSGESKFTSTKLPWILVYSKAYELKRDALIEEKRIKKLNRKSLELLISKNAAL
jgi:putative endonuclease